MRPAATGKASLSCRSQGAPGGPELAQRLRTVDAKYLDLVPICFASAG
jgi:hypothetical protein